MLSDSLNTSAGRSSPNFPSNFVHRSTTLALPEFCLAGLKLLWIALALKTLAPPSALRQAIMTTMTTLSPPLSPSADYSPSGGPSSRPRAVSMLSNHSRKSRRSSSSGAKLDLTETHADKKYLHTKADPSKAINEAQPGEPRKDNLKQKTLC